MSAAFPPGQYVWGLNPLDEQQKEGRPAIVLWCTETDALVAFAGRIAPARVDRDPFACYLSLRGGNHTLSPHRAEPRSSGARALSG